MREPNHYMRQRKRELRATDQRLRQESAFYTALAYGIDKDPARVRDEICGRTPKTDAWLWVYAAALCLYDGSIPDSPRGLRRRLGCCRRKVIKDHWSAARQEFTPSHIQGRLELPDGHPALLRYRLSLASKGLQ